MYTPSDHFWMQEAIKRAQYAEQQQEVPVGAILVHEDKIVGEGWNQVIQTHDPSAHAEIMALRMAGQHFANYRLLNTTLYVTLEPCVMCVGTLVQARIRRIVFGASEPKTGALGGAVNVLELNHWNHQLDCTGGVMAKECGTLLTDFFKKRR